MAEYRGIDLRYRCETSRLPPSLADGYLRLDADEPTRAWIDDALAHPAGPVRTSLRRAATVVMSDYDANGLFGTYAMRVLGTDQWRQLLGYGGGRLLDVGAGDGAVTAEIAPLFDEVIATETSRAMARRLRRRGYRTLKLDVTTEPLPIGGPFDAVALLNVIDRTSRPLSLLERARDLIAPNGRVIVAVPLPLRPHVHVGARTIDPDEQLPIEAEDFETALAALISRVLLPAGLTVERFTRAPYLSRGDTRQPIYVLDDAILVCRRIGATAP